MLFLLIVFIDISRYLIVTYRNQLSFKILKRVTIGKLIVVLFHQNNINSYLSLNRFAIFITNVSTTGEY